MMGGLDVQFLVKYRTSLIMPGLSGLQWLASRSAINHQERKS
jgi:hypothetical protein